jgi:homoaconitase/3-isopropylmalate dehydratase large subunit
MEAAALCGPRAVYCAPATAADADASFRYDFSTLAPYYGAWTAAGFDAGPVSGKAAAYVDRVVIGPGLPAAEIRRAAAVVRGRRAHSDVVLWLVAPGGAGEDARRDGSLAAWEGAGATAFLAGEAPWPEMLTSAGAVATTARAVFESCRDRGVPAYLVNPTTAAAAALAGELTDPTPLCGIISE